MRCSTNKRARFGLRVSALVMRRARRGCLSTRSCGLAFRSSFHTSIRSERSARAHPPAARRSWTRRTWSFCITQAELAMFTEDRTFQHASERGMLTILSTLLKSLPQPSHSHVIIGLCFASCRARSFLLEKPPSVACGHPSCRQKSVFECRL